MGQLVFQATAGGQVALVGPNPSTSFALNLPAINGNLITSGDTGTVTNTMLASNIYTAPGTIGSVTPNTGAFTTIALGGNTQNQQLGQGNASIMKNRIINGAMVIDQRNAGASVTPAASTYTLDRWNLSMSQASKLTIGQNLGGLTGTSLPIGFQNYLGILTASAVSIGAGDFFFLIQPIEGFNTADLGWGTANAKTVTLSFQVYSSLTGTFGGSITNSAFNRSYPFSYTILSANTWTTISVIIAGDTTGTWVGATNGSGLNLRFGLGVGSTYSGTAGSWSANGYFSATGATSVVGTNGATFYITGVQLEVGSSATGFEYRQYQQELALCQRYFWSTGSSTSAYVCGGLSYASTSALLNLALPVSMRTSPTSSASFVYELNGSATPIAINSLTVNTVTPNYQQIGLVGVVTLGLIAGQATALLIGNGSNAGYLQLSAEL